MTQTLTKQASTSWHVSLCTHAFPCMLYHPCRPEACPAAQRWLPPQVWHLRNQPPELGRCEVACRLLTQFRMSQHRAVPHRGCSTLSWSLADKPLLVLPCLSWTHVPNMWVCVGFERVQACQGHLRWLMHWLDELSLSTQHVLRDSITRWRDRLYWALHGACAPLLCCVCSMWLR